MMQTAYNPGSSYVVKSPMGQRIHPITGELKGHKGIDHSRAPGVSMIVGRPTPAAADGFVVDKGFQQYGNTGWGNYVVLEHTRADGTTFQTLYAHLQQTSPLSIGDPIQGGPKSAWPRMMIRLRFGGRDEK